MSTKATRECLAREARGWVEAKLEAADERGWSFEAVCAHLRLDAGRTRQAILSGAWAEEHDRRLQPSRPRAGLDEATWTLDRMNRRYAAKKAAQTGAS